MSKDIIKDVVKQDDVLWGYYQGFDTRRHARFASFRVAKVGRKYLYDAYNKKIEVRFDPKVTPQTYDIIAEDTDPNHRYKYYQTREAAERGFKVRRLAAQLRTVSYDKLPGDTILQLAELAGLDMD